MTARVSSVMWNGWVYLYYTKAANGKNRIERYTAFGNMGGNPYVVLDDIGPAVVGLGEDNGGGLVFGSDGALYAGVGEMENDGEAASDASNLGKVLQITFNADRTVAAVNRYAKGFRNVAGLAVNKYTGTLYGTDNYDADDTCDEVNVVQGAANYGWNVASCGDGNQQTPLQTVSPQTGLAGLTAYRLEVPDAPGLLRSDVSFLHHGLPASTSSRSTWRVSPATTRYCLLPVSNTAYIKKFAPFKGDGDKTKKWPSLSTPNLRYFQVPEEEFLPEQCKTSKNQEVDGPANGVNYKSMSRDRSLKPGLKVLLLLYCITGQLCAQEKLERISWGDFQHWLSNELAEARFERALWGVKIVSQDTGQVVFSHNEQKLLSPASNSKLYTMAMGLNGLGPDYRIRTSLYANKKPNKQGVLAGDLVAYGRGDPTFDSKLHGGDILKALEPLAAALTNGCKTDQE